MAQFGGIGLPPFFVLIFATIAVAIVELALSVLWAPVYFRFGIPVFTWSARPRVRAERLPPAEDIASRLHPGVFTPLVMRELTPDLYAFREAAWRSRLRLRYTPVMRGTLEIDRSGSLKVVGRLNWWILLLAASFATFAARVGSIASPPGAVLTLFLILLAGFYGTQRRRYRAVGEQAVEVLNGAC